MANQVRRPFTPGGKFVASKDFRFGGRRYAKGDEFPWRQLSCSVRRLRLLYEGRLVNNEYIDEEELADVAEETIEELDTDEELDETEEEPVKSGDLIFDPEIHTVENPGRGEWYMVKDGVRIVELTAKEAKRLQKRTSMTPVNPNAIVEE